MTFLSGLSECHRLLGPSLIQCTVSQSARRGLLREGMCLHSPSVKAKAPGGWAPAVRSQSQAPGVAVAPRSARAPPPPRSRSRSLRPSPVLVAAGPGQIDFLLFCRAEGCRLRVTGYGLRATGYGLQAAGFGRSHRRRRHLTAHARPHDPPSRRRGQRAPRSGARRAGAREMRSRHGGAIGATAPVPGR